MIRFSTSGGGEFYSGDAIKAIKKALRLTIKQTKKAAAERMRARYVKPEIGTRPLKSKVFGLSGVIQSQGSRNALEKFQVRPRGRLKKPPKGGIFSQVVRGQGGYIGSAFFAKKGIFVRETKKRLPIRRLFSVAAPQMLKAAPVSSKIVSELQRRFYANLQSVL